MDGVNEYPISVLKSDLWKDGSGKNILPSSEQAAPRTEFNEILFPSIEQPYFWTELDVRVGTMRFLRARQVGRGHSPLGPLASLLSVIPYSYCSPLNCY